jgi:hypothetical protein
MPDLPDHPDLDQLRRQARELLRAAADGQPHATARLRAVSDRVTLSVAQLALAREYGFESWPALRTEAERRRLRSATGRWSFGGANAIQTAAGTLSIAGLVSGPDYATVDACLLPAQQIHVPLEQTSVERQAALRALASDRQTRFDDLTITDDLGTNYTLSVLYWSISYRQSGQPERWHLRLVPAPAHECAWLELRNRDGVTTRLWPSRRPTVRVGVPTPLSGSLAERDLSHRALSLISMYLSTPGDAGAEFLRQQCAAAIAEAEEVRQSGALDAASELPDQLARLCAVLCEQHPADGLPPAWSGMLDVARRTDGPELNFDVPAALPLIADTQIRLDSLMSEPGSWRLYLRATPQWWIYSEDGSQQRAVLSVHAEDKLGGMYLGTFDGGSQRGDHEEVTLNFVPRLDPLARAVKVIFSGTGEQVSADLHLDSPAGP